MSFMKQHVLGIVKVLGLLAGVSLTVVAAIYIYTVPQGIAGGKAASTDTTVFCDRGHKVAFIDAMHCGGMSSCDRDSLLTAAGETDMTTENICPKPR